MQVYVYRVCAWSSYSSEDGVRLELWMVVSHHVVLEIKSRSSARAGSGPNCLPITPAHHCATYIPYIAVCHVFLLIRFKIFFKSLSAFFVIT